MLELHLRKFLGNLDDRIHEAEGGREDDLAVFARQPFDGAVCIGTFRNILDIARLDLVAQFLLDLLAALVVLIGIAEVADRADIDPAGLELLGLRKSTT